MFRYSSLTRWLLCGRFASKKCDLHGRNSRHFLCRPLVACFCGSTIHRDHMTSCYDFSFKWFHFDVILTSFWSHFGVQNGLRDLFRPPGINLGSIWDPWGSSCAKFHRLGPSVFGSFLDQFSTSFVFARKHVEFGVQILVFVPRLIFERFLIDFEVTFGGQKWSKV